MSVNWTKLVASGRAKDIGMPFNEEELVSLTTIAQEKKLSFIEVAPFIREHGAISVEEYEALSKADDGVTRKDLEKKAKELGIDFSGDTPDTTLQSHINKTEKPSVPKPAKAAKKTTEKGAKKEK